MAEKLTHRISRLRSRIRELEFWVPQELMPVEGWQIDGRPIAIGEAWPDADGLKRLTVEEVRIPDGWDPSRARLELHLGGEALVTLRYADGSVESFGHDEYHHRFPLSSAVFAIDAEAVARFAFGQPNRDPHLEQANLMVVDSAVHSLARHLSMTLEMVKALGDHAAADALLQTAERAVARLQWPSATEVYDSRVAFGPRMRSIWRFPPELETRPIALTYDERASVQQSLEGLQNDLRSLQTTFPPQGAVNLIGHAHIDLAWLWPIQETRRKARRSFHTALGLADRFPEFKFCQSTAQLYAFLEQDDPQLFDRIKEKIEQGQWEPVGGMWVEADTNMPSGESLVRQLLYGQRYFHRHFGRYHRVAWLPDSFGFTPGFPQILRLAGIDRFFTIKLSWSETNRFPYDLFRWEGLDGSRVLAHMFDNPEHVDTKTAGYNGNPTPFALLETWKNFVGKEFAGSTMLSIGYGDGGGGPTREMLEQQRDLQNFPVVPSTQFTSVDEFFEELDSATREKELPVWSGELYLELHRGTLTTQGRTKRLHRKAERDLVAAEIVGVMNALAGGSVPKSLEEQWHVLLRNEFHDILPGSSIREVYEQTERELSEVIAAAGSVIGNELGALARRLVESGDREVALVVNPDLTPRPVRVLLTEQVPGSQEVEEGCLFAGAEEVPGLSAAVVTATDDLPSLSVSPQQLENDYVRIEIASDGTLTSVFDKRVGREALAGRGNQIWAYVDKPRAWDAWDVDAGYVREGQEIADVESLEVREEGPYRAAVRVVRRFRNSVIIQDIRLWANSSRLEFKTTLDWHDRRWLLKTRFPLAVRSDYATFETAFGVVARSTHRNTSWEAARFEVAAHRFADLSEPGFGVALLNDGKYGHHAVGNELGISLLRSPVYPDPLADEGLQTFTYALLPHAGAWWEGGVLAEAEDLNRPLLATKVLASGEALTREPWRALQVEGMSLGLGALKPAEDRDGLVLRVYEPQGARGEVRLRLPDGWTISEPTDLLERPLELADPVLAPFKLRSWLLTRD